jgi:hypothetical protein
VRSATVARLGLGTVCAVAPGRVLAAVAGRDQDDPRVVAVTRVLGGRLLLQAGADLAFGPRTRTADVLVEVAHAASMLPAALIWPTHRRSALASAAGATSIALLDVAGRSGRRRRG